MITVSPIRLSSHFCDDRPLFVYFILLLNRTESTGRELATRPMKKRSERRKHIARPGCSKVRTPPAGTVNGSLVADPSIQVPGFNLPRRLWCTLNRFRTGQGRCAASLTRWQQITDPTCCDCGAPQQTMMHIVEDCPVTRFPTPERSSGSTSC